MKFLLGMLRLVLKIIMVIVFYVILKVHFLLYILNNLILKNT